MQFSESFILGLVGALGGLISLIFSSMRKSRCGTINCCCGLFSCNRDVLTTDEMRLEPISPKLKINV